VAEHAGHEEGGHGTKSVVVALFANLGIAIAKFVGFVITGAASMLAEAIHSVADSGNQAVLLLGGRRAKRGPDQQHPFGHGRTRYFAAFMVAVILFTMGSLFSLYEGYEKLVHPHEIESPSVALIILAVAIALETFSLRTAVKEATPLRGDQSWWSFIRTTKKPELAVVLLEDAAAELGLVFAFAGVGLAALTGDALYDGIGTLAIGALLGAVAVILAIEMHSLLIGEAASPAEQTAIRTAIETSPGIVDIADLRTMHLGPDELLVAGRVVIDHGMSSDQAARVIDDTSDRIRAAAPSARIIYLEPDLPAVAGRATGRTSS
jgi:cation diffusion facilitator family transporter